MEKADGDFIWPCLSKKKTPLSQRPTHVRSLKEKELAISDSPIITITNKKKSGNTIGADNDAWGFNFGVIPVPGLCSH